MQEKPRGGLFSRLSKTRNSLTSGLTSLFKRGVKLDQSLYQEAKDQLIMADIGIEPSQGITEALRARAKSEKPQTAEALPDTLIEQITDILHGAERALDGSGHQPS